MISIHTTGLWLRIIASILNLDKDCKDWKTAYVIKTEPTESSSKIREETV